MRMKAKRTLLYRAATLAVLLALAVLMFIVGRGHTVFFDNKTFEYDNQSYPAAYKVIVQVNDKEVAKLMKRERGMATWMGQNFKMNLEVTQEKGGEPVLYPVALKLPYAMDGIILNIPAMLAGLGQEVYQKEFIVQEVQTEAVPEEIITDELFPADI